MTDYGHKRLGSAEIAGELRREIGEGRLGPGERFPAERVLATAHGVARGTVREAINLLAAEGLVEIRPGSGTYIKAGQVQDSNMVVENASPLELIDTRFALEPYMCRLAVLHATREDLNRLDSLLARMDDSEGRVEDFSKLDTVFHTLLAQTTRNRLLIWIVSQTNSVRNQKPWSRMRHLTLTPKMIARYNIQHRQIVEAIASREPERAAMLMKAHLEDARLSLTRAAAT